MKLDKEKWSQFDCACKNLKFCACDISYDGRKFLGTRCWDYLRFNKVNEKFEEELDYPVVEGPTLVVWNLDEKKFEYLLIEKLEYAYVNTYRGQFYLK